MLPCIRWNVWLYINPFPRLYSVMESSAPLSNVFSADYNYFELYHAQYPADASAVFKCVADLRMALQVFRGSAQQIDAVGVLRTGSMFETSAVECPSSAAAPALLPSVADETDA